MIRKVDGQLNRMVKEKLSEEVILEQGPKEREGAILASIWEKSTTGRRSKCKDHEAGASLREWRKTVGKSVEWEGKKRARVQTL